MPPQSSGLLSELAAWRLLKETPVASPSVTIYSALCLLAAMQVAHGQNAFFPADQLNGTGAAPSPAVNAYGMLVAQNDAAIEQSRLYRQTTPPVSAGVDANGNALPEAEATSSDDDSFGAQKILKTQERRRFFVVSGGASLVYTDNVALTRRGTRDDVFAVANAGINWTPQLGNNLEGSFGANASIFRYNKAEALDFENFGLNAGVSWSPPTLRGVSFFARYDLSELLNGDGDQILFDQSLTLGVQKAIPLARSQGIVMGATASWGVSNPSSAQRSQLGGFIGYHLQLTRKLQTDFLFRPAVHFYTDSDRVDYNQILSWNLRYQFNDWAEVNATLTYGVNRSERAVFDYNVLTTGAGVGAAIRF